MEKEKMKNEVCAFMKKVLLIGESSLAPSQYKAFRKMVFDHYDECLKRLEKGLCGNKQNDGKGGGDMIG